MILVQVFKTSEGVRKRCAFESHHSQTHVYRPVRLWRGQIDTAEWSRERHADYTWKIEKEPLTRKR